MPNHTRRTVTYARRIAWGSGVMTLATLVLWVVGVLPDARLTLAVYFTLVCGTGASVVVAALGANQVAIHHAFAAGYQTGAASVWPEDAETHPAPEDDPVLRLVE